MNRIYGFMVDNDYVSNQHNVLSPICELSAFSETFSLDTRHYQLTNYPNKDLLVMKSVDEVSRIEFTLNSDQVELTMKVYERVKAYALSNSLQYDMNDYRTYLYAHFPDLANFQLGEIVEHIDMGMPAWFSFMNGEDYIHIWLSDLAFRNQYPFFDIKVLPPITNLDTFFAPLSSIQMALSERTSTVLNQEIETLKGKQPYTYIRFLDFDYVYPANPAIRVKTTWVVLIHGRVGDYIDHIKDALVDYILKHTTQSEAAWRVIFPEIFRRTEFILVPRWDRMAIENMDLLSGVYQSMFNLREMHQFVNRVVDFYQEGHVLENTLVFPHDYKSIMIGAVRGPENREGAQYLDVMFRDYIPVNTASLDFNRMRRYTKDWSLKLQEMLMVAETATEFSIIYNDAARRTYRNNRLFIAFMYDDVNYLIAARSNTDYQT